MKEEIKKQVLEKVELAKKYGNPFTEEEIIDLTTKDTLKTVEGIVDKWARKTFMYKSYETHRMSRHHSVIKRTGKRRWNVYKKDVDELREKLKMEGMG